MARMSECFSVTWILISFLALTSSDTPSCKNCESKIPLEIALLLNTVTDESQLFRDFVKSEEQMILKAAAGPLLGFSPDSVSDRFGGGDQSEGIERKAVSIPKPAGCIPELKSVSLRRSEDPWIYYWPSCTRVEQCGGCCSHQLLSCQPIESETINYQVVVTEYVGSQLLFKGKEIVSVEKHTKCKCDCITKQKDCNPLQEYRKGECRCVCKNKDAEAKCNAENSDEKKHWNPATCSCDCAQVLDCSTGTYFNQSTCSCESSPDSLLSDRYGYTLADNTSEVAAPPPRRRWPINIFYGRK